jgi:elongation factor 2 kinase
MVYLAKAYDVGGDLLGDRSRSWSAAIKWYARAVAQDTGDEEGNYDATMETPSYQLIARQAEMYRDAGYGLDRDYVKASQLFGVAADLAMAAMKGRLANKYYAAVEEVNQLIEE